MTRRVIEHPNIRGCDNKDQTTIKVILRVIISCTHFCFAKGASTMFTLCAITDVASGCILLRKQEKYSYKKMAVVGRTKTGKGKNIKIEMLEKQRLLTFQIVSVYNAFLSKELLTLLARLLDIYIFFAIVYKFHEKEKNYQN